MAEPLSLLENPPPLREPLPPAIATNASAATSNESPLRIGVPGTYANATSRKATLPRPPSQAVACGASSIPTAASSSSITRSAEARARCRMSLVWAIVRMGLCSRHQKPR